MWDSKEKGKSVILCCCHAMIELYETNRVPLIQLESNLYYFLMSQIIGEIKFK